MVKMMVQGVLILAGIALLAGCGGSDHKKKSSAAPFEIRSVTLPIDTLYLNSKHTLELEIYSPRSYSADNNDTVIFFFFSLEDVDDVNGTVWIESMALETIDAGLNSYSFDFSLPSDLNGTSYRLNVQATDSEDIIDEYETAAFTILPNDGKPDIEILTLTLDLEHSGDDSEYDTLLSSEVNSTAVSLTTTTPPTIPLSLLRDEERFYIHSTVTMRSHLQDASNVSVSACLDIGSQCLTLPILQNETRVDAEDDNTTLPFNPEDEDNETVTAARTPVYVDSITIPFMEANADRMLSLDFEVKASDLVTLATAIASDLDGALDATLKVTVAVSGESTLDGADDNTKSYPLSLSLDPEWLAYLDSLGTLPITLSAKRPQATSGECGLKKLNYEKEYERYKYGKRFGAGAYLKGRGWLDAEGVHGKAYGSIRVRRFSETKFQLLGASLTADIIPSSFADTGYNIVISSLGENRFTFSESLATLTGLDEPEVSVSEEEQTLLKTTGIRSSETNATVTDEASLRRQKRIRKAKENLATYKSENTTATTLVSVSHSKRFVKGIERKQTIMFSIIPIVVTAGASATVGYDAEIGLDGITSMTAMIEPNAYIRGYLDAGVGAGVSCCGQEIEFSAGVGGWLWLISERFTTTVNASLNFIEDSAYPDYIVGVKGDLSENITNYLSTMKGEIYAYVKYWGPYDFDEPFSEWKNRTKKKTFADWEGSQYTRTLLDKSQTLFTIPFAEECE